MKNWKTTLMGFAAAALMVFCQAAKDRAANPKAPAITFNNIAPAVGVAVLGKLCADAAQKDESNVN